MAERAEAEMSQLEQDKQRQDDLIARLSSDADRLRTALRLNPVQTGVQTEQANLQPDRCCQRRSSNSRRSSAPSDSTDVPDNRRLQRRVSDRHRVPPRRHTAGAGAARPDGPIPSPVRPIGAGAPGGDRHRLAVTGRGRPTTPMEDGPADARNERRHACQRCGQQLGALQEQIVHRHGEIGDRLEADRERERQLRADVSALEKNDYHLKSLEADADTELQLRQKMAERAEAEMSQLEQDQQRQRVD
ncbi:uncharacterized protein LOC122374414 [Amphibalanus amphitrite]|uniref:uncharacterized protein LOC122374414 n=1 Tax=Amphibalanus amphitrite TaxID=1232801 RepID=UPI001C9226CD|nr:uncharacterized protein LOC122374414 [Amphibalanus amphitrite]